MSDVPSTQSNLKLISSWSWVQIGIICGVVLLLMFAAGISFYLYRRRIYRKYGIALDRSSSTRHLRKNWTQANLHTPRRFGGLLRDIRHVREEDRLSGWSIDADDAEHEDTEAQQYNYHHQEPSLSFLSQQFHNSNQHNRNIPMLSSNPFSQDFIRGNTMQQNNSSTPETTIPFNSSLLSPRPAFDIEQRSAPVQFFRPFREVIHGRRHPPVYVVSTPPQQGFIIDDYDNHSKNQPHISSRPIPAHNRSLSETTLIASLNSTRNSNEDNRNGRESMSGLGNSCQVIDEELVSSPQQENRFRDADGRSVILISRVPGQDFSIASSEAGTELPPYIAQQSAEEPVDHFDVIGANSAYQSPNTQKKSNSTQSNSSLNPAQTHSSTQRQTYRQPYTSFSNFL